MRPSNCNAIVLILLLFWAVSGYSEHTAIHLSFANLADWKEKTFKGHTSYSHVTDDGKIVLKAVAKGTASALYKKIAVDATELPIIKWSWKVNQALPAENLYRKDVDDFAARVSVIFPGTFFWQYKAVVYVWSDKLPLDTVIASAFDNNIVLIVVKTGNKLAGTWQHEQRNYFEDYRGFFHTSPPKTMAVAVMTDADNTNTEAVAWYSDIFLAKIPGNSKP